MTRNHKIRMAFFLGTVLFLLICSALYAKEFRDLFYSNDIISESPEHIYVDGADFGGIFQIVSAGVGSFVLTLTIISYGLFVVIGNIIFFLVLRFAAIKKDSEVSAIEYSISLRAMIICWGIILIASFIITGGGFVLYTLSLFWQTPLFGTLLYLLPLKKRISK